MGMMMTTKYFADDQGRYIGAYSAVVKGGETVWPQLPENGIEVPSAPENAAAMWVDGQWVMPPKDYAQLRREAYVAAGVTMEAIAEALIEHAGNRPQKLLQLMALRDQVRAEIPKP